jgi:putative membrane protein
MGYSDWNHMSGMGWGLGGGLLMVLVVVAAVVLVVALTKSYSGWSPGIGSTREKSPLDILKERYARGEIGLEEFEEKKRDLH